MNTASSASPLVLVCGSDNNYAMPLAVMLFSALSRLSPACDVHVYLIDGGLHDRSRQRLRRVVQSARPKARLEVLAPDPPPRLGGLAEQKWLTAAAYLRLLIPDLVSVQYAKALYLDSDLLVQADLSELWHCDLAGQLLLATQDDIITNVAHPEGLPNYAGLGLAPDTLYFNSGVLILDPQGWREEAISARVLRYIREHTALIHYADQDGLNAVLANRWTPLGPQWNLAANFLWAGDWADAALRESGRSRRSLLAGPNICHFSGQSKPWRPSCPYPVKSHWLRALWHSGCSGRQTRTQLMQIECHAMNARATDEWAKITFPAVRNVTS